MASIPGFRFDISGASGSQGLLAPKESWRAWVFPRGAYASQDSTGTLITFDSASVASRFAVGNWIQVGTNPANVRQVSAVGGNSVAVSGSAVTVATNTRVLIIGNTEPTISGNSATYTSPASVIRQRDDDAATAYTNSMITTDSNGNVFGYGAASFYDVLLQDGNQSNQAIISDMEVGTVNGISVTDDAVFGGSISVTGNATITGNVTISGLLQSKKGPWQVFAASQYASGSSTGGIQEAHDAAPAMGGAVALDAGTTFSILTPVVVSKPITVFGFGESSLVQNAHATGVDCFRVTGTSAYFYNFKVDGQNATRTSGRGFSLAGATGTVIDHVKIKNTWDAGIGSNLNSVAGAYLKVLFCDIDKSSGGGATDPYGIIINNITDALVEGCNIVGSSLNMGVFGFNGSHRARIANNRIDLAENGVRWGSTTTFPLCDGWTVIGNQISNSFTDGIRADGNSATIIGNACWGSSNSGIKMDGATARVLIEGNRCTGNANKGIYINNANGNISDIMVRGNLCEGNTGDGIRVHPVSSSNPIVRVSIIDNESLNNLGYGLQISDAGVSSSVTVRGNILNGNSQNEQLHAANWTYEYTRPTKRGSDIVGGVTITVPTDGNCFLVTGNTTATGGISWNPWDNGSMVSLIVGTSLTINDTAAATLAGNYSGVTYGQLVVRGFSGQWVEASRSVN